MALEECHIRIKKKKQLAVCIVYFSCHTCVLTIHKWNTKQLLRNFQEFMDGVNVYHKL